MINRKQDPSIELEEINIETQTDNNSNNMDNSSAQPILPPSQIVYPEDVHFWEESLTGGGVPMTYTDKQGITYTRQCFPSLGFAMYIPDGWRQVNHSNDYLQNIQYYVTNQSGFEETQLSIAVKTNIKGLSPGEIRSLFATDKNNLEYHFDNDKFKFITSMTTSWEFHQINTSDIPGFEDIDAKVLVYYEEPKVKFVLEKNVSYSVEPYVIHYYIIKENTAIMLSAVGPYAKANNILALMASMGLNCRELVNDPPTAIHFSADKEVNAKGISYKIPEAWTTKCNFSKGNYSITAYSCSTDLSDYLYGTEILVSGPISIEEVPSVTDIINNNKISSLIAYSCLNGYNTIPGNILDNLDYSIKYNPKEIKDVSFSGKIATQIPFTMSIDELSLTRQLSLIENPFNGTMYVFSHDNNYYFIVIKGTHISSYFNDLISSFVSTISFS